MTLNPPSRRERHVLNQWIALRDRGFLSVLCRRSWLWVFWTACFLPGMLSRSPYRPYFIGAFVGFVMHNLMTLRASHAFWPIMRQFIDWERVEERMEEVRERSSDRELV